MHAIAGSPWRDCTFAQRYDARLQDQTPPKDPSIEVRVLKDYGEVFLTLGRANLKKGTVHLLPRTEAEPLIREGVLESVAHDVHLS